MLRRLALLVVLTVAAVGCAGGPPPPAPPLFQESAGEYTLDPGHSCVVFRVKHLSVAYFYGRFNQVEGDLNLDFTDNSKNKLNVRILADSIDTNAQGRDDHLKSPQFFDVENHPTVTFVSHTMEHQGGNVYRVTGDLTLLGQTKRVTVPAIQIGCGNDPWGGYRTGLEIVFEIKRTDFGMDAMTDLLGDRILLQVALEAIKNKDETTGS